MSRTRIVIRRLPKRLIKMAIILYPFLLFRHFLKSTNIYYHGRLRTNNGYKSLGFLLLRPRDQALTRAKGSALEGSEAGLKECRNVGM